MLRDTAFQARLPALILEVPLKFSTIKVQHPPRSKDMFSSFRPREVEVGFMINLEVAKRKE